MIKSQITDLQILQVCPTGILANGARDFALGNPEIIILITDRFCVNETKKLVAFRLHNFPNELLEMAGGTQICSQLDCYH